MKMKTMPALNQFSHMLGEHLAKQVTPTTVEDVWASIEMKTHLILHPEDTLQESVRNFVLDVIDDRPKNVTSLEEADRSFWRMYQLSTLQTIHKILQMSDIQEQQSCYDNHHFYCRGYQKERDFPQNAVSPLMGIHQRTRSYLKKYFQTETTEIKKETGMRLKMNRTCSRVVEYTTPQQEITRGFAAIREHEYKADDPKNYTISVGSNEIRRRKAGLQELRIEVLGLDPSMSAPDFSKTGISLAHALIDISRFQKKAIVLGLEDPA